MKKIVLASAVSILIAAAAYAAVNITHPNLKDAYSATEQAVKHIQEAQQYSGNKQVEFGGHAENALNHLKQAEAELVAGDQYNNAHQKK
jgi:Skp family chaperone for outer membrane proteins